MSETLKQTPRALIARSREGNLELAAQLKAVGIESTTLDTIFFEEPGNWAQVDALLRRLATFDWIVLTSPTGVSFFARRLGHLGLRGTWSDGPRVAAVGERTAERLRAEGLRVDFVPTDYLTSRLGSDLPDNAGRNVLLLRADIADKELVSTLTTRGFLVTDAVIYRTQQSRGSFAEPPKDVSIVVFASPSEVEGFARLIPEPHFSRLAIQATAACIGPVTADAAKRFGFQKILVAPVHTVDGLVREIQRSTKIAR